MRRCSLLRLACVANGGHGPGDLAFEFIWRDIGERSADPVKAGVAAPLVRSQKGSTSTSAHAPRGRQECFEVRLGMRAPTLTPPVRHLLATFVARNHSPSTSQVIQSPGFSPTRSQVHFGTHSWPFVEIRAWARVLVECRWRLFILGSCRLRCHSHACRNPGGKASRERHSNQREKPNSAAHRSVTRRSLAKLPSSSAAKISSRR